MSRNRARWVGVMLGILLVSIASPVLAAGEGEERVRSDLERFLRAGAPQGEVRIDVPPLASFIVDRSRVAGDLRTQLSTRADRPFSGRVAVTVELYAGDRLVRRGVVSPYVRIAERVVVPNRDLRRGDILSEEDLVFKEWDQSKVPSDAVLDPAQAIGLRARRTIRSGQPFRLSQVEGVPIVERGDRVRIVLEMGRLHVQAMGRAQEKGAVGDWIRVQNLDSKREVTGRVDHEGAVHVSF